MCATRASVRTVSPAVSLWLVAGLSAALYAGTIGYGYVDYDDTTILTAHPELYDETSFTSSLHQIFVGYLPREEPLLLRDVTWAAESRLFGFRAAWPRHLGNVLLNAANSAWAIALFAALTGRRRLAVGIGLAWSLLAVRAEPVAWVMGRKDVLSAFFSLAALYVETRRWEGRARAWAYVASLLLVLAACTSKVSALPLFAVLVVLRARSLEPRDVARTALRYAPHAAVSLLVYLWYARMLAEFGVTGRSPGFSLEYLGILFDLVPLSMAEYLRLLVLPFDLSIAYQLPSVNVALTPEQVVVSRLSSVVIIGVTVALARWRRDLLYLWLAFGLSMITYLNLVYIGIWVADRYLYLPSLFLVALVALLVAPILSGPRGPLRAAVGGLIAGILAINTVQALVHQRAWEDNLALWTHEMARERPTLLAHQAMAREKLRRATLPQLPLPERVALWQEIDQLLDAGLAEAARLAARTSVYYSTEINYHAKLLHYRGRLGEARGAPLADQIAAFQAAYDLKPLDRLHTMTLAKKYFEVAVRATTDEARDDAARASLRYFGEYMAGAYRDPAARADILVMLDTNYARFAVLDSERSALRARYFGAGQP